MLLTSTEEPDAPAEPPPYTEIRRPFTSTSVRPLPRPRSDTVAMLPPP